MFEEYETSNLINLILYIKKKNRCNTGDSSLLTSLYNSCYTELSKRSPVMAMLYSYESIFETAESGNKQEYNGEDNE